MPRLTGSVVAELKHRRPSVIAKLECMKTLSPSQNSTGKIKAEISWLCFSVNLTCWFSSLLAKKYGGGESEEKEVFLFKHLFLMVFGPQYIECFFVCVTSAEGWRKRSVCRHFSRSVGVGCLSVCLSIYLSIYISCLSIYLSTFFVSFAVKKCWQISVKKLRLTIG